jgi:hypothetical protein
MPANYELKGKTSMYSLSLPILHFFGTELRTAVVLLSHIVITSFKVAFSPLTYRSFVRICSNVNRFTPYHILAFPLSLHQYPIVQKEAAACLLKPTVLRRPHTMNHCVQKCRYTGRRSVVVFSSTYIFTTETEKEDVRIHSPESSFPEFISLQYDTTVVVSEVVVAAVS